MTYQIVLRNPGSWRRVPALDRANGFRSGHERSTGRRQSAFIQFVPAACRLVPHTNSFHCDSIHEPLIFIIDENLLWNKFHCGCLARISRRNLQLLENELCKCRFIKMLFHVTLWSLRRPIRLLPLYKFVNIFLLSSEVSLVNISVRYYCGHLTRFSAMEFLNLHEKFA
jgi:hypothetical protein